MSEKFVKTDHGRLINVRLEEHRAKDIEIWQKRQKAAMARWASKADDDQPSVRANGDAHGNAHAYAHAMHPSPSPSPSPSPTPSPPPKEKDSPSLRSGAPVRKTNSSGTERVKSADIEAIFEHWQTVYLHPKAVLTPKRRRLIASALHDYSTADLCQAITGYQNSAHHMGENDRHTVYDDIELLLRDAKHIEAGMRFYDQPPRQGYSSLTEKNIRNTENWVPPEMRKGDAKQ